MLSDSPFLITVCHDRNLSATNIDGGKVYLRTFLREIHTCNLYSLDLSYVNCSCRSRLLFRETSKTLLICFKSVKFNSKVLTSLIVLKFSCSRLIHAWFLFVWLNVSFFKSEKPQTCSILLSFCHFCRLFSLNQNGVPKLSLGF